jgi:tetratricopeptide (TPR) repeat protein
MAERRHALALPEGIPATHKEEEQKLLARLRQQLSDAEFRDSLYELGCFYNRFARNDLAVQVMKILMTYCEDPEEQAFCYMSLGQISEQDGQCALGIRYYAAGLKLGPKAKLVAYLLHNNIGSCLNSEKRYKEGEQFCRVAIQIDSGRSAAFKNLGISLQGQGDVVGAAWAYAEASRADPSDTRAARLLRTLVAGHPKTLSHLVHVFLREQPVADLIS